MLKEITWIYQARIEHL